MLKIATVVGARPQFVKAAVVSRAFKNETSVNEVIIHTGQHFDKNMSDLFFEQMNIPQPDYNLAINGGGHGAMTGRMLEEIEKVLVKEHPDYVLVYGDTNSTIAGALAAKKLHIRVAHVEAGLRSFNMNMPEEINRILTDRISDVLFCPTKNAVENLSKEGFPFSRCKIIQCGDVMQDAALYYAKISSSRSRIIQQLGLENKNYLLCTVHRQENTDDMERLTSIFQALDILSENHLIVCPMHPRTKKIMETRGLSSKAKIIEPVGYFDMIELLKNCKLVLTDSGGLQKEAFFFGKYCVTLRDETEWVELVENGVNSLAGAVKEKIVSMVNENVQKPVDSGKDLYGNGEAAKTVISYFSSLKK